MIVLAELMAHPPAERRPGFAKIDSDIEYPPPRYADEFSLGLPYLVMQTPEHVAGRPRMVILHELYIQFELIPECARIPCFQEEPALVLEHARLQEQNIRDVRADHLHGRDCCSSSTRRSK
jgi:hypothetical protein